MYIYVREVLIKLANAFYNRYGIYLLPTPGMALQSRAGGTLYTYIVSHPLSRYTTTHAQLYIYGEGGQDNTRQSKVRLCYIHSYFLATIPRSMYMRTYICTSRNVLYLAGVIPTHPCLRTLLPPFPVISAPPVVVMV